jgi:mannose/fructose/N-acetylgalactosamine-specific phosphotransferase system component IIC
MKLVFGLFGALLMIGFLASFVIKVKEISMIAVAVIGIVLMLIDLWQARNEADT